MVMLVMPMGGMLYGMPRVVAVGYAPGVMGVLVVLSARVL